jgi:IS5 family transposase
MHPATGRTENRKQAALERSPAFKVQRFWVGIEGRISVLFRGRGMKRCRAKAASGSRCWWARRAGQQPDADRANA